MASNVDIANRALQKLGAKRITSLTQDSRNARAVNASFETLKEAELREHPWNFSIKRVALAAEVTAPAFGKTNFFQLPSDYLRLLNPDPSLNYNDLDWQIEGRKIATNDSAPLNFRYVSNVTDPNQMDVLFREALSSRIALELCEEITQSNTKKDDARIDYNSAIAKAKKTNAIERTAMSSPTDTWISIRS